MKIGEKYGRLTVIEFSYKKRRKNWCYRYYWKFRCDCGNLKVINVDDVKSGHTKSCGCLNSELSRKRKLTHGMYNSPAYKCWQGIKRRCCNQNEINYAYYGAKGITVCDRWKDSFVNFLEDMGEKPIGMTIDRINSKGNYEPNNCRWATYKTQNNNKKSNRLITFKNKTKTLCQWSEQLLINRGTLSSRLDRSKWSVEKAFNTPILNQ